MRIVYCLGMLVSGFIGGLSILRTMELLFIGGGLYFTQLLIGVVMLALAFLCMRKARAAQPTIATNESQDS